MKLCIPLIAFAATVATLCIAADDDKHSTAARHVASEKREQIDAEIKTLRAHDWAGKYYAGDGMGVNQVLILAPETGFEFEWRGCLGLYDLNYGSLKESDGAIRLSFALSNNREGFRGLASDFRVVRWGGRRYLVPADQIVEFCNAVNAGEEPRVEAHGSQLLRQGDEEKPAVGWPDVPEQYRDYLLKTPIQAKVLKIGSPTTRPAIIDSFHFVDTPVTIDAGRADGIRPGMQLYFHQQNLVQSVQVVSVEEHQSQTVMNSMSDSIPAIHEGSELSTRPSWARISFTP